MESDAAWARIVVVNHNAGALLQLCLDALKAQSFGDFEAVIVDNASTDGSIETLRLPDARFSVLQAGENLGFAAGTNLGTVGCKTKWIATLNPDAMPKEGWLEELRRATARYPDVGMFGSTQINARHPDRVDGFGDAYSIFGTAWRGASGHPMASLPGEDREVFAPCAAAAFYSRELFQSEGGFDESLFCYMEDVDLGFRLQLRGHALRAGPPRRGAACRLGDDRHQQRLLPVPQPAQPDLGDGQGRPLAALLAHASAASCGRAVRCLTAGKRRLGGGVSRRHGWA